jgi:hypothetical protein
MRTYGTVDLWLHGVLTWALDGDKYHYHFIPGERDPNAYWMGDLKQPTASSFHQLKNK